MKRSKLICLVLLSLAIAGVGFLYYKFFVFNGFSSLSQEQTFILRSPNGRISLEIVVYDPGATGSRTTSIYLMGQPHTVENALTSRQIFDGVEIHWTETSDDFCAVFNRDGIIGLRNDCVGEYVDLVNL